MDAHRHPTITWLLAVLACFGPASATALDEPCERPAEPRREAEPMSLRGKASRFAPRLAIRLWFRTVGDSRRAATLLPSGVTTAPTPTRREADLAEPFGWEVGLRWNLVDMADSADLLEMEEPKLVPTRCLGRGELADDDGGQP